MTDVETQLPPMPMSTTLDEKAKIVQEEEDEDGYEFSTLQTTLEESNGKIKMIMTLHSATCCGLCLNHFKECDLKKTDDLIEQICNNSAHYPLKLKDPTARITSSMATEIANTLAEKHRRREQFGKRYCNSCFEKSMLQHSGNSKYFYSSDEQVHLTCPFCFDFKNQTYRGILKTEVMLRLFDPDLMKPLSERLEQEFVSRNYSISFCPIANCTFKQIGAKRDQRQSWSEVSAPSFSHEQVLKCPDHGQRCIICWKGIDGDVNSHKCRGFPDEIMLPPPEKNVEPGQDLVCRCPQCYSAVWRNGGCAHMTCRCGAHFNWELAKVVVKEEEKKETVRTDDANQSISAAAATATTATPTVSTFVEIVAVSIEKEMDEAKEGEKKAAKEESRYNLRKRKTDSEVASESNKKQKGEGKEEEEKEEEEKEEIEEK